MIYVHLTTLAVLFITVASADLYGLMWVLGKRETLSLRVLYTLHWIVWIGLGTMIVSGIMLALPLASYLAVTPAFYTKMFFVLALIINSVIIGRHLHIASEKPFANLMPQEKKSLMVSGVVSSVSWLGAFVSALLMSSSQWLLYFWSLLT